jgi:ferrous iron transport protein B
MGILYGGEGTVYGNLASTFTAVSGYSFLAFNLLCAPCFAAMGAIKREMNNPKWFWFAIGYQCGFAYLVALVVNQFGNLATGNANILGVIVAAAIVVFAIYMLVRPYKEASKLTRKVSA